jgi:putative ABC transport system permease protein
VREREIAVRTALGAGRGRIVGQLLTESLVLALLAGAVGLVLASWGTRGLLALAPEGIPRLDEVGMNGTVFAFALVAAAVCGCFFGLVPAMRSTGAPLIAPLKDSGRSGTGRRQRRVERALVVAEVALALVLSAGAGLLIRSFGALQRVSPGFDAGRLLTFELQLPRTQYPGAPSIRAFFDDLLQRLEALPGVRSAALTISLPPNILRVTDNFMVEGQVLPPNQGAPVGPVVMVSEKYFSTLGVPLVRGRVFDERDNATAPPVVIVNEALAAKYFSGVDPIGRRFKIGGPERPIGPDNPWQTVVGVVGNVSYSGLDAPPEPTYYMPFQQNAWRGQFVVVRAAADAGQLVAGIRSIVASIDRDIPVARLHTMDDLIATSVAPPRFRTTLVTAFAASGLLLAAIGIYGVMASAVADRTHELGVRIALGADRSSVLRLVLGEAAALTAIGVAVGIAGTLPAARLMRSLLFGVSATDVLTLAGTSALLTATAFVASYVPARRAMRIDPVVVLRNE